MHDVYVVVRQRPRVVSAVVVWTYAPYLSDVLVAPAYRVCARGRESQVSRVSNAPAFYALPPRVCSKRTWAAGKHMNPPRVVMNEGEHAVLPLFVENTSRVGFTLSDSKMPSMPGHFMSKTAGWGCAKTAGWAEVRFSMDSNGV